MVDWNKRYAKAGAGGLFGTEPNVYVRQVLARPGFEARTALVLADGDGRNGRYLARNGLDVTAVDLSETGTLFAREEDARCGVAVERIVADLATWTAPAGNAWEAAFVIYLQCERAVRLRTVALAWAALAPGGWFALEAFAQAGPSPEKMGPDDPELLYTLDDVTGALDGATIVEALTGVVRLEEGARHSGLAHVVRVCARKP